MTGKNQKALESMLEQGFSQLRDGQFEEAIETFSTCHVLEAGDDRPLRGRGLAYSQLGNPSSAEKDFLKATELNKSEPENFMGLGMSLAMQNKIYEAIKVYEDLLVLNPTLVSGYLQLGRLQIKIGAISKGRDVLAKAMTLRPTLVQRRMIEAAIKEQDVLDKNRYYRPDFVRLNKQSGETLLSLALKNLFARFKKKAETPTAKSNTMSQV